MFCPHCGKEIGDQQAFCQFCGAGTAAAASSQGQGRTPPPWEDEAMQWTLKGFTATLRRSLFEPSAFFRSLQVTGGLSHPLLYALISCMAGFMLSYLWQILLHDVTPDFLMPGSIRGGRSELLFSGIGMVATAVLLPFFVILFLFLWTGVFHVLLLMVRGAKNGFEATFRTVAYSSGTGLLLAVPVCGWVLASVWNIVIMVIGLREAHGTTGGKSAFVVLFPLVLCCAAAVLFSLLVLGTVAASLGTMQHQPWK